MKKATYLLLSHFLLNLSVLSAQTMISGIVKDAEGIPIPYVNVLFSGTVIGTITNDAGEFVLSSDATHDELAVSLLGYSSQKLNLTRKRNHNIVVTLVEGEQLNEVVVVLKPKKRLRKKENPAYPILKQIWAKKHKNGVHSFAALEYQKFTSFEVGIKNLDSSFLKTVLQKDFDSVRSALKQQNSSKAYMPLNLKEQVENVYINDSLDLERTVTLGERISGLEPKGYFFEQMQRVFQDIDVYKNRILFADKVFESPLSRNGFATYDYVLLDSIAVEKEKIYTIYFFPRRSEDLAFTGSFTVSAPSYALTKINMRIDPAINLNLVSGLNLEKTFLIENDSVYLPKSNRYAGEFSVVKKAENAKTLSVIKSEFFDQYSFNMPKVEAFYKNQKMQVAEKEFQEEKAFWDAFENNKNYSKDTRSILTEIKNNSKMKRILQFTDFFTGGYANIVPGVQFGKWWNSFNNNDVEGNRLRLGFRTFKTMEDRFRSNAYIAYGFGDSKMKYAFDVKYLLKQDPRITVGAIYSKDFEQLGSRLLKTKNLIDFSSGGTNSYLARGSNYYLSDIERFGVNLDFGFSNNFHVGLNLISEQIASAAPDFFSISSTQNNRVVSEYKHVQLNSYVQYTPRRNVFGYGVEQRFGVNLHPKFVLKYSQGIKGLFGGVLDYNKVQLSYNQTLLLNFMGNLDANFELGKTYGVVPLPLLNAIPSNQGYSLKPKTFSLLNYYDMVADSYLMGHFEHHFNGFISNKVPLIKKFKLRTLATFRFAYGSTSAQNRNINQSNIQYNSPDSGLYYEYGFGFENIGYGNVRFFRVDFIWRSPLASSFKLNPYSSQLPDFGIRVGAKPSL